MKIDEITICLHAGSRQDVVDNQMKALSGLEKKYDVYWNKRIERYPYAYDSYSELINEAIVTSATEFFILVNDRVLPTVEQVEKMINQLESGFACAMQWNVGFMGMSKELIRRIGWWDHRYTNGGWEDRDWVFRLIGNNLAFYESQESDYDFSWKSPLQVLDGVEGSTPHWNNKWRITPTEVIQTMSDEDYPDLNEMIGDDRFDISDTWKTHEHSCIAMDEMGRRCRGYDKPNSGPPGTFYSFNKKVILHGE